MVLSLRINPIYTGVGGASTTTTTAVVAAGKKW